MLQAGLAGRARRALVTAAVYSCLRPILALVFTGAIQADPLDAGVADTIAIFVADPTRLTSLAGVSTAIDIRLSSVQSHVDAARGDADSIDTIPVDAVVVFVARKSIGTGRALTATVHSGLSSIFDAVIARWITTSPTFTNEAQAVGGLTAHIPCFAGIAGATATVDI